MGTIADKLAGRVATLSSEASDTSSAEESDEAVADAAEESTASAEQAPPEAQTIEEATGEAPAAEPDELTLRKSILQEKLAAARERRQAASREKLARQSRAQIEADREAARAEREKWEALKTGSFKDGLKALGRDPLKTFQELEREAAEANTPEGQLARMREEFQARIDAAEKRLQEVEQEREQERRSAAEQAVVTRFESDFSRQIAAPDYKILRVAYEDEELLQFAHGYRQAPKAFFADAERLGVRLTNPAKGFTMREILSVLKAAQETYEGKRKAREAKLSGQSGGQADRSRVNGTSAPEAVSTIGVDLASRASSGGETPRISRAQRIEREIDRLERRR